MQAGASTSYPLGANIHHNGFSKRWVWRPRRATLVQASDRFPGSRGNDGPGSWDGEDQGRRPANSRRARQPGFFEVQDITPPGRSLGIHAFPPATHNGDEIEVSGGSYVVQNVVLQYKLVKGKYKQDHRRLEVHQTGRFLYNKFLETVYKLDISKE